MNAQIPSKIIAIAGLVALSASFTTNLASAQDFSEDCSHMLEFQQRKTVQIGGDSVTLAKDGHGRYFACYVNREARSSYNHEDYVQLDGFGVKFAVEVGGGPEYFHVTPPAPYAVYPPDIQEVEDGQAVTVLIAPAMS